MNPKNGLYFSGGPGPLPEGSLLQVKASVISVPELGLWTLGVSLGTPDACGNPREKPLQNQIAGTCTTGLPC